MFHWPVLQAHHECRSTTACMACYLRSRSAQARRSASGSLARMSLLLLASAVFIDSACQYHHKTHKLYEPIRQQQMQLELSYQCAFALLRIREFDSGKLRIRFYLLLDGNERRQAKCF